MRYESKSHGHSEIFISLPDLIKAYSPRWHLLSRLVHSTALIAPRSLVLHHPLRLAPAPTIRQDKHQDTPVEISQ